MQTSRSCWTCSSTSSCCAPSATSPRPRCRCACRRASSSTSAPR